MDNIFSFLIGLAIYIRAASLCRLWEIELKTLRLDLFYLSILGAWLIISAAYKVLVPISLACIVVDCVFFSLLWFRPQKLCLAHIIPFVIVIGISLMIPIDENVLRIIGGVSIIPFLFIIRKETCNYSRLLFCFYVMSILQYIPGTAGNIFEFIRLLPIMLYLKNGK